MAMKSYVANSIVFCSERLWDTLRSRFSIVNGPRIQRLKSSIARCEQTKTMSIATYFGKLTALWEELNNYEPLIQCSCCNTCTAGKEHKKRRDNTRLHQFLMGLYPDNFSQTRAHILSQDPLPTIDRAYQLLVQDERVRLTTPFPEDKPPQAVGFAVRTPPGRNRSDQRSSPAGASSDQRDKSILFCSHCRESGHVISGCFALNGYPEWWPPGSSKQQSGPSGNSGRSGRGRQPPTTARGRGGYVKAHAVAAATRVFSPDQWKILASFIGNTKVSDDRLTGEFDCNSWIIDTGASRHVTCNDSWLFDVHNVTFLVGLPNGKFVVATKEGSVYLSDNLTLKHDQLREPIGTSIRRDGLFYFEGVNPAQQILVNAVSSTLDFMAQKDGDKFPLSDNKASRIFEKVHCDLWGLYRHPSSCDARYFLTIVDDFSRAVWLYLVIDKTEVFNMFMSFVAMIDRQFSQTIKNGRVERKHKHILNVARALRFQANLPIYFWGESVLTAAHLINRTPTPLLQNKSPFEILFNKTPSYDTIRTFGCLFFAQNQKTNGDKFASRSRKCVFMGYPFGQKGWKLFDLDSKQFFVSRDVKLFEDVFPFLDPDATNITPEHIVPIHNHVDYDFSDCSIDCLPHSSPNISQPNTTNDTPYSSPNLSSPQRMPQYQTSKQAAFIPDPTITQPTYTIPPNQQPLHSQPTSSQPTYSPPNSSQSVSAQQNTQPSVSNQPIFRNQPFRT
ncbi:uncharacterized protein LOC130801095 [Amaranthus tricolor]|uniref:uncharacterized protein LOC130801095 n=1 Tax=Amaranthus tricolor TaxID=29722 RepID=UPI00258C3F1E|nr:uncharacterized protein LOC130801095 [Amaranthus tricolor]